MYSGNGSLYIILVFFSFLKCFILDCDGFVCFPCTLLFGAVLVNAR
jgi:hypothetical protein